VLIVDCVPESGKRNRRTHQEAQASLYNRWLAVVKGILLFPYNSTKGTVKRLEFNELRRGELFVCRQDMGTCGRWAGSFWEGGGRF
jgi:hypothetical protein